MPRKMQGMNNKVTSKGPLISDGLDVSPCHQHFNTLSRDAVPPRILIDSVVVDTTAGQRSEDVKGLRDVGMKVA